MPNGSAHIIAGAVCGAFVSLQLQQRLHGKEQLDLGHLILCSGTGAAMGRLPDILEPPIHPNHRAFFHSFTIGAILGFAAAELWKEIGEKSRERRTRGVQQLSCAEILLAISFIGIIVFLLHLVMDGLTPMGLLVI